MELENENCFQLLLNLGEYDWELNQNGLEELAREIGDRPVAVISISGPYRTGKGFLFSLFIKYLTWLESGKRGGWITDEDRLDGFTWRSGPNRDTVGIHVYKRPFIIKKEGGQEIAVILMDMMGIYDTQAGPVIAKVFALFMLISSFQIYNLRSLVNEVDLQHLSVFTQIGAAVSNRQDNRFKVLPDLLFLIRDWENPNEYGYGINGGRGYLTDVLQIKEKQCEELRNVRQHMHRAFNRCLGFLLPHPGFTVSNDNSMEKLIGDMKTINGFLTYTKELFDLLVDQMEPKKIDGIVVTGNELVILVESFSDILINGNIPAATSVLDAFATHVNAEAEQLAKTFYREEMQRKAEDFDILLRERQNDSGIGRVINHGRELLFDEVAKQIEKSHEDTANFALITFENNIYVDNLPLADNNRNSLIDFLNAELANLQSNHTKNKNATLKSLIPLVFLGGVALTGGAAYALAGEGAAIAGVATARIAQAAQQFGPVLLAAMGQLPRT